MGFPENLTKVRKERRLSQEELAELLEVSRQAVSKWEQGMGYPEVEKLLMISEKLNVSLDSLMRDEVDSDSDEPLNAPKSDSILIRSPYENVIACCNKVKASERMSGGKHAPQYALGGSESRGSSFWGDQSTFLAWYATYEEISKEVEEIYNAMMRGEAAYTLQYSVRVEKRGLSVRIVS